MSTEKEHKDCSGHLLIKVTFYSPRAVSTPESLPFKTFEQKCDLLRGHLACKLYHLQNEGSLVCTKDSEQLWCSTQCSHKFFCL